MLLKQNKKRISRRQIGLITVGSGVSSSGSTTSSSTKSRTTSPPPRAPSPAFGSPLRRSAGLAEEEEEYTAVHGHRRVDVDEDVELERASNRGKKKRTLAQTQAEEAPAEGGREREKRRIREDFDVAAQRLQDVTNAFGARVSMPTLDTNIFGISYETHSETSLTDLKSAPQSKTNNERRRIPIRICHRPHSCTVRLVRHCRHPGTALAPSHLTIPRNSSPLPIPLPGAAAADAEASTDGPGTARAYGGASTTPGRSSAPAYPTLYPYYLTIHATERCANPSQ